ncbi:hypothetical protein EIG84_01495 [Flavobacteriaceae bacterium 14752]|nr:hypothetical protein EIG84_01495 [Flavobacteriaceae bacterium 14752]
MNNNQNGQRYLGKVKRQTVNSQQSTVNSQQSTVNSEQSTVNSQQSTVNSQNKKISPHPSGELEGAPKSSPFGGVRGGIKILTLWGS